MNGYFKASSALEYIETGETEFTIDVQILKQSIMMFGSASDVSCELELREQLILKMKQENMVTECELSLFDSQALYDLQEAFFDSDTICKLILPADIIKIAFQELDDTCDTIQFKVSQSSPNLEFSAVGLAGESRILFSNNPIVMDSFYCETDCSFQYSFKMVQSSFKALILATKVNIRINEQGLLCLQYLLPFSDRDSFFLDVYIIPLK
jgi:cell cycle checkpoint protein